MFGGAELSVEMIELGDELVDALGNVLALLVGFEKPTFERADRAPLLFQLATKADVLFHLAFIRADEIFDDAFQSLEVEGTVSLRAGNDSPPRPGSYRRTRKGVKDSTQV